MKNKILSNINFSLLQRREFKKRVGKIGLLLLSLGTFQAEAQETITLYDGVLFYGGYTPLFTAEQLYEPIPEDIIRHSNSKYAKKITDAQLDMIGNTLDIDVVLEAACDNYDRLGHVFVAFVPKGSETYVQNSVSRIEIARFITPFMNKNNSPTSVSYHYTVDNVAEILTNTGLRAEYDFWLELDVFGTTGAGQTQVAGCSGKEDTFRATLSITTGDDSQFTYDDEMLLMPLQAKRNLNNYNNTDVPGETTRLINFTLDAEAEDLKLFLITSNHGANENGEEYVRRRHFVYLNNNLIYQYIPGGKNCEPYRQFNTQGNGIYGQYEKPLRGWIYWNNWCPGDAIPLHEISLGTLPAGEYTLKIDVPDAVFNAGQGNIPLSAYLQNRNSGNVPTCMIPAEFTVQSISHNEIAADWEEIGTADEWELLYGKIYNSSGQTTSAVLAEEDYHIVSGDSQTIIQENLDPETVYQIFVRSKCGDNNSMWSKALYLQTQVLSLEENTVEPFVYYPNPVENNLFLEAGSREINEISLYDIQGRQVIQKMISGTQGLLNMEHLSSGVYFLKVNVSDTVQTYKIEKK